MDIGTIVSWVQAVIWVLALVIYIVRLVSGKSQMPNWIRRTLSSNVTIGVIIACGLMLSGISLYLTRTNGWMMNVSDWNNYSFKKVSNRTFKSETVDLDGNEFIDCSFDSVTFVYNGQPFKFSGSSPIKGAPPVLRTTNARLLNYLILLGQLKLLDPSAHTTMPNGQIQFDAPGGDLNQLFNKDRPK